MANSDMALPDEADWRRRGELKSLLTTCRSRLGRRSPAGGRGLRQEDAAILTGLSVRSYAALERGAAKPSRALVESVASGLRMTPAERSALHVLATGQDPPIPAAPPGVGSPDISADMRDLIDRLDPLPAIITDEMWTVMARNQAAAAWTGGWFDRYPREQQNLVLFLFSAEGERLLPGVHQHRRAAVAGLRYQYARNIGSDRFAALIGKLLETGPEARRLWERHDIEIPRRQTSVRLRYPGRGLIEARALMSPLSARVRLVLTLLPEGLPPPAQLLTASLRRGPPGRPSAAGPTMLARPLRTGPVTASCSISGPISRSSQFRMRAGIPLPNSCCGAPES